MEKKEADQLDNSKKQGTIKISEDVVATIAGLAAAEVSGVAGMSGGITGDLVEKLGRKNISKGIKAEVDENEVTIDISVIVEYGVNIHTVAVDLQNSIRNAIENMTGLSVVNVNVNIQGLSFGSENKEEDGQANK
ncbi:MAG: Asp23/Gls24 family envelope stress response protein [Desulfotomaculaceae bacterium]|nr:Asp23/Gls24 family envelope stress response protein [Desulfotomaculaceae bacterium]MDD4766684.1 Asp23/Gls24 family envelope stress response protein [Desulfotomaculaceae bacterium]